MNKINIPGETWISINDLERIVCEHDLYKKKYEKKFYDEILPIFDYSKRCDAKEIYFINDRKQNNNFDGKIKLLNGNIISIECTNAINESRAEKRSRSLAQFNYYHIPSLSTEINCYANDVAMIIDTAIKNKTSKKNKYENFYLIVTVSDPYFEYATSNDIERISIKIKNIINLNQFQKVILYKPFKFGYPKFILEIDNENKII